MKKKNTDKPHHGLYEYYPSFDILIRTLRENAGFSRVELTAKIGCGKNTVESYEFPKPKRLPPLAYLVDFCFVLELPLWQLLRRRIAMGEAKENATQSALDQIGPLYRYIYPQPSDQIGEPPVVYQLPDKGSAQSIHTTTRHQLIAICSQLIERYHDDPNIRLMKHDGSSMTPTINHGDTMIIDSSKKILTEGDIFVMPFGETTVARRIQLAPNDGIILIADNSPQFHSKELSKAEVAELKVYGKLLSTISEYG